MHHQNVFALALALFVFSLVGHIMAGSEGDKNITPNKKHDSMQIAQAVAGEKTIGQEELSTRATIVLQNLMLEPPDRQIPKALIDKANCIGVFPSVTKAGLIVAGQHGRGLVACRHDKTRMWGAPAFFTVTGTSFGVQAGYKTADVIMLVMDPKGVDALLSGAMTIGSGGVTASSGSVGHSADVATMKSSIITYARPDKGLFAGADLGFPVLYFL
jgi:lipid-binding SYLF domain-containing protein